MKKLFIVMLFGLLPFVSTNAQENKTNSEVQNVEIQKPIADEGTFLLIPQSKTLEMFTIDAMLELRAFVERNRKEEEDVIISYSIYTEILILSRKKITKADFRPFATLYE